MPSILPLIFSILILSACGKHDQVSDGRQGIANTLQVTTDALSQNVLDENLTALESYSKKGGDLNIELPNGRTLLTEACQWSKFKVIDFLVARKVDMEKKDRSGRSALDYGNEDIAINRALFPELILGLKLSLFKAAKANQMIELKKILEESPPVNFFLVHAELGEEISGFEGETLLTFCIKKKLENVLRLIAQPKTGLDVNLANARGESPLKISRELKYKNIEKLLLKLGATE